MSEASLIAQKWQFQEESWGRGVVGVVVPPPILPAPSPAITLLLRLLLEVDKLRAGGITIPTTLPTPTLYPTPHPFPTGRYNDNV